ncbi:integral peroxisomal membrane peroxin-domain-containing protein [Chytridium lagenaria]|nr:integral peroxisomal membrane peroxin-domain-containing protein [Chytridium lagenaria]
MGVYCDTGRPQQPSPSSAQPSSASLTTAWRVVTGTVPKIVGETLGRWANKVVMAIPVPDSAVDMAMGVGEEVGAWNKKEGDVVAELYENQRWWAGPGWTSNLLNLERPPFSDITGVTSHPSLTAITDPAPGWAWTTESWTLDLTWTTVDAEGWEYSDHTWNSKTSQPTIFSLTRRRKWVRGMRKVEEVNAGAKKRN